MASEIHIMFKDIETNIQPILNNTVSNDINDEVIESVKKRAWKDMFPNMHPNMVAREKCLTPEKNLRTF